jgi:hypothetical protein
MKDDGGKYFEKKLIQPLNNGSVECYFLLTRDLSIVKMISFDDLQVIA